MVSRLAVRWVVMLSLAGCGPASVARGVAVPEAARLDTRTASFPGASVSGPITLAAVWGEPGDSWRDAPTTGAAITPDGRLAVFDGGAVYEVANGRRRGEVALPDDGRAAQLVFSGDGRRMAALDPAAGCVAVWSLATLERASCLPLDELSPARVALSPDGESMVTWTKRGELARWDLATGTRVWSQTFAPVKAKFVTLVLAWVDAETVIVSFGGWISARDAQSGAVRWSTSRPMHALIGARGGELVILGDGLVALALETGAVRRRAAAQGRYGAFLSDGSVVLVDNEGRAELHGRDLGRTKEFRVASGVWSFAVAGDTALLFGDGRMQRWDMRRAVPRDLEDRQGAVIAVAADRERIVSGSADGSVVVHRRDGGPPRYQAARTRGCSTWAFSPSLRYAACENWFGSMGARSGEVEWFALDGREGAGGVTRGWIRPRPLGWFGDDTLFADGKLVDRTSGARTELANPLPRQPASAREGAGQSCFPATWRLESFIDSANVVTAAVDDDDLALGKVVYAGARSASPPGMNIPVYRDVYAGLAVQRRDGYVVLDRTVELEALAAARDAIAVAGTRELQLWTRAGAGAPWHRRWRVTPAAGDRDWQAWEGAIAVTAGGTRVAVAARRRHEVVVHDGATGAPIATVHLDGVDATALAFAGDYLFVGTSTGRVLELRLDR